MSKSNNKQLTRQQQELAAKYFGKHVAPATALIAVISAVLLCLAPILMGLRYWEQIPELIITGLKDPSGNDDSLPAGRWYTPYRG